MPNPDRRARLTRLMAEQGWDLLLCYGHAWRKDFFRYALNFNFQGPHAVAALDLSGEIRAAVSDPWDAEPLPAPLFCEPQFEHSLAALLRSSRPATVAIAGLEFMEERFVQTVRQHARRPPVSATATIEKLRRVKDADEISLMRQAADLADRGYRRLVEAAEVGLREYELVAEVEAFLKSNGAEDNFMLIASGGIDMIAMRPPTDRKLQPGDTVITELTPQVGGYFAQICRTLVLGEPTAAQKQAFAIFLEAQSAAQNLLRPGLNISELARAQNDVFREHGFGDFTGPRYTRVRGHGLGLHFDETPHVLEETDYVVKEGMTLIPHPNTYLPLSGYMVLGDTLLVTADGCASMNKTERKLFQKAG